MSRAADLCQALGLGSELATVLSPLRAVYAEVDELVGRGAEGLGLPCKTGCDACCHESVFLSAPEFLAVAVELFDTRTAPQLATVVTQMRAIAAEFEDELEMLETFDAGPERDEVAARIKFRCPLLSRDGRCSVYAARELNGRTFGQAWDSARDEPYGCGLTVTRLNVIGGEVRSGLADAREARQRLVQACPGTERVHVYPWWFDRYARWFVGG